MNRIILPAVCSIALLLPALLIAGCRTHATVPAEDARDRTTTGGRAASDQQWQTFGEPVAHEVEQVDLADVLAQPAAYEGRQIRLVGTVTEVCGEKGCWLRMADPDGGEEALFVKFTCPIDDSYLIPQSAVGRQAVVEGEVVVEEVEESVARHYAQDAGKSPEEIEQIQGPQRVIRVMSPSARVAMY